MPGSPRSIGAMQSWKYVWLGVACLGALGLGCSDDSTGASGSGGAAAAGGSGGAGGMVPAPPLDCDPLAPEYCGVPYPNDYWTEEDESTVTGRSASVSPG